MRQLTTDNLTALLADQQPPCISLYQPTHRHYPDSQQDAIRYRNLLAELESSLKRKYPTREVRPLQEKFQALAYDDRFWNYRTNGLAVFGSSDTFQVFELQRTVPELVVVADSFHTKSLLCVLQTAERYQILALNRHGAKLYEGNRLALDPVELTNVPSTISEALGEELTEQHLTVASYGAGAARSVGGATPSIHAHGDRKDELDIDRDRFFTAIDRALLKYHSRPSGLPLMLAALPEYHAPFRAVSHNPFLMADGIKGDPEALSLDELRAASWRIVEPAYQQRLTKLVDDFQIAQSRQLGSNDITHVAEAAMAGRVGTLLVEDGRQVPGKLDCGTGRIQAADLVDPQVDDLLDDLAETVLRMKGEVLVVPADRIPSKSGVAAIYRY